jgi:hypothetical protein
MMTTTDAPIPPTIPAAAKENRKGQTAAPLDSTPSKKALWSGRALSGLAALFLIFDAVMKLLELPVVMQSTTQVGYPATVVFPLGVVLLACVVVYLVPRSSALGAVLLTGYLGGAVATNVRVGNPLFSHTLFPIYCAALLWVGLWLRDERLQAVLPVRATK